MDKILPPPPPLDLTGDVAGNWKKFDQKLELYLQATGKDAANNKTKTAILLTVGGTEAIELYNTFTFTEDDKEEDVVKFSVVVAKFKEYCDPRKMKHMKGTFSGHVFKKNKNR